MRQGKPNQYGKVEYMGCMSILTLRAGVLLLLPLGKG
jgi:hypothetical protein